MLAINATLEKAKTKQGNEIRDLRRKLRERSVHLPYPPLPLSPPASSYASSSTTGRNDFDPDTSYDEDECYEKELDWAGIVDQDPAFGDIVRVVEGLLRKGTEAIALQAKLDDHRLLGGPRVLGQASSSSSINNLSELAMSTHGLGIVNDSDAEASLDDASEADDTFAADDSADLSHSTSEGDESFEGQRGPLRASPRMLSFRPHQSPAISSAVSSRAPVRTAA